MENKIKFRAAFLFAISFLFLFSFGKAYGQLGIRMALNLPNWSVSSGDPDAFGPINPQSYTGYQIYLTLDPFDRGKHQGVEIGYTQRGFKAQNIAGVGDEATFQLDYIDLALPLKFKSGSNRSSLLLQFGPYMGYAVDGKLKTKFLGQKNTESLDFADLEIKRFDWGGICGLGFWFPTGEDGEAIALDFRYSYGFQNLNNGSDSKKTKVRNTALNFGVTYCFGRR